MFDIPLFSASPFWYAGLIWALVMGWAASSYASNFSYRLPRQETPFGREPYCGDCDVKLTPRDLFPVFSWALTGGKCRNCGAQVPCSYFLLELLYMPYIGLCYIAFGFGDMFLLMGFAAMLLQISAMMAWDDDYVSSNVTVILLAAGLIFQILQGNLLVDGLMGIFFGLFGALLLYAMIERKSPPKDVYVLPKWIWLLAATGAWLNAHTMLVFIGVGATLLLVSRVLGIKKPIPAMIVVAQAPALLLALWWGLAS
ncbi:MAG: prepilin peptidase [Rickettsiales bacterium]|nr:prepilin peptidase [Rickettsiales bacterium]